MLGHTHFDNCPDCGKDGLKVTRAGVVDAALGNVGQWLGRVQSKHTSRL